MRLIAHLIPDDPKFVAYIVDYFSNVAPGRNVFILMGKNCSTYREFPSLLFSRDDGTKVSDMLQRASAVITHGMYPAQVLLINQLPSTIPVGWIVFGTEYHEELPEFSHNLYFKQTKKVAETLSGKKRQRGGFLGEMVHFPRRILRLAKEWRLERRRCGAIRNAFKRAQFVGCFIDDEVRLIKSKIALRAKQCRFSYYNIEDTIGTALFDQTMTGNDVLVGNSSYPASNHLEAFQILSPHRESFDHVIAPLCYGDDRYRTIVVENGVKHFGDQFVPLTRFEERAAYNRRLASCKVAVMNHRRQQAVGNIITLLWFGSKVFLTEESTVRRWLKNQGLHVYSVEQDLAGAKVSDHPLRPLDVDQLEVNRTRLKKLLSKKAVLLGVKELVDALDNSCNVNAP